MKKELSTLPNVFRYSLYALMATGIVELVVIMSYLPGFMK